MGQGRHHVAAGPRNPALIFGLTAGRLAHVDEVARGLACSCICPVCAEPLLAKKGEEREHHFAHMADSQCRPCPETLAHRFAKEAVARRLSAILPAFLAQCEFTHGADVAQAWGREPVSVFEADSAEVEYRGFPGFVPDVLLSKGREKLAVEVHFRHPVPREKIELISRRYLTAVEVSLTDLPADSSASAVDRALSDPRRWRWLNNRSPLAGEIQEGLERSHALYFPRRVYMPPLRCATATVPRRKLEAANARSAEAHDLLGKLRSGSTTYFAAPAELKLALNCYLLGVQPLQLPVNLMQKVRGQSLIHEHAVYWQTWAFLKFGAGERVFAAQEVARAARQAFPSASAPTKRIQTANGFTRDDELFYEFFLQLADQDLVLPILGGSSWETRFRPRFPNLKAATKHLLTLQPAVG